VIFLISLASSSEIDIALCIAVRLMAYNSNMDEDAPTIEKIHTHVDERREQRRTMRAHMRKSSCYKAAYSRKQALTQANTLLKQGFTEYVRAYKCRICGYFHLTSQAPRFSHDQEKKGGMK
jgi:hypothetical protein